MRHRWLRTTVLVVCFAAAAATGYWVSAQLGAEALRREAELRLSTVMQGSVTIARARVVVRGGLFLEGEVVGVYPDDSAQRLPALTASRVSAEIDVLALLTGRFRLNGLLLEDAVLEIRRSPEDVWSPPPAQWVLGRGSDGSGRSDRSGEAFERSLDWVNTVEEVTRWLLEAPRLARRVEIRRGRVTWSDARAQGGPVAVGLYRMQGRLVHHWLSGDAELRLQAAFVEAGRPPVPLSAEGWQRGGDEMRLAVSASRLPISYLVSYLEPTGADSRLEALWSGQIAYETQAEGHGTVSLQGALEDFAMVLTAREGTFDLARPLVHIDGALEIHPGRVRLSRGRLESEGVEISLAGSVGRPLGPRARARLDVGVGGLGLDEVRSIVGSLPDADGQTLEAVLERIDDGRIERIGARGTARVDEWASLFLGEAARLPRGFVLSASVADVRIRTGRTSRLSHVGGVLEVSGDRLRLRDATGLWNDTPLPRLAVSIQGVSQLFRSGDPAEGGSSGAGALPGLGALLAIVRGDDDTEAGADDAEERGNTPRVRLWIDRLDHPILRWPITDTRVAIERTGTTTRLGFEQGRWAGAPFEGEAVWRSDASEELVIGIRMAERGTEPSDRSPPSRSESRAPRDAWAAGRFEVAGIASSRWPFREVAGRFTLVGTQLDLLDGHARLAPRGVAQADLSLDLDQTEAIATALRFEVEGGDVGRIGEAFGLPADYATGMLHASGRLSGEVRPQTPILTSISGEIRLDAREGELRRDELPLVVALAQASAGYNDYASRDAIAYDSVGVGLHFDRGRISTEDFELDGPLRIYASGSVDAVHPPNEIVAIVGLFLFRSAGQIMETIPLVKAFLPGSEKGLVGAYFEVRGPFDSPDVRALAGRSVEEDLPDVLAAPYKVLRALLGRDARRQKPGRDDTRDETTSPVEEGAR